MAPNQDWRARQTTGIFGSCNQYGHLDPPGVRAGLAPDRRLHDYHCSVDGTAIATPDFSCISKRSVELPAILLTGALQPGSVVIVDSTALKVYGKDEWHQEKHAVPAHRTSRKLHLAIDEHSQVLGAVSPNRRNLCSSPKARLGDCPALGEGQTTVSHAGSS